MRLSIYLSSLCATAAACVGPVEPGVALDDNLLVAAPAGRAGYLEVERSPVFPFCNAVLVAPRVALTPRACVVSLAPSRIVAHFPGPSHWGGIQVQSIRYAGEFAALTLGASASEGRAKLALPDEGTCDLRVEGFAHGPRGSEARPLTWTACLADSDADLLRVDLVSGTDVCHHTSGAAVFSGDVLVGMVMGAEPNGGCATTVHAVPATSLPID